MSPEPQDRVGCLLCRHRDGIYRDGRAADAKALCEKALALLTEEDRAYFTLYDALEVAYAMSEAMKMKSVITATRSGC
jgi:hypothetical protein